MGRLSAPRAPKAIRSPVADGCADNQLVQAAKAAVDLVQDRLTHEQDDPRDDADNQQWYEIAAEQAPGIRVRCADGRLDRSASDWTGGSPRGFETRHVCF